MLCRKQTLIVLSILPTSKDFVTSQVHAVLQGWPSERGRHFKPMNKIDPILFII